MSLNQYNQIAELYNKSHTKPDKLFSILPTILNITKNSNNPKVVIDLGCGDGFFTFPLANIFPNAQIIGIDNSKIQIEAASRNLNDSSLKNITFIESDIFKNQIPKSDIIVAPFIFGYCTEVSLDNFLLKIKDSLNEDGLLVALLDDPEGKDNSKFGARKILKENIIDIQLYDENGGALPILHAFYHKPEQFLQKLKKSGFNAIKIHTPIISEEGIDKYGEEWWGDYKNSSELCYISCNK